MLVTSERISARFVFIMENRMTKIVVSITLIITLSACAGLEQAPLIYTSTVTVGASTGVNSTETPGFSFVFGYKHVDAAYVPVAVSKPSPENSNGDILKTRTYDLILVGGEQSNNNSTRGQKGTSEAEIRIAIDKVNSLQEVYSVWVDEKNISEDNLDKISGEKSRLNSMLAKAKIVITNNPTPNESYTTESLEIVKSEIEQYSTRIAELSVRESTALKKINDATVGLKHANSELTKAKDDLENLAAKYGVELNERREVQGKYDKKDAYSVYGSFDSRNSGSSEGASNDLGKVFSTGVAAQTLADAELVKANVRNTTSCLKELSNILSNLKEDKKEEVTLEIIKMCTFKESIGR